MKTARQRCLFLTMGDFSSSNRGLLTALRAARTDIEFDVYDVGRETRRRYLRLLQCAMGTLTEYGPSAFASRARLRYRLLRSQAYYCLASRLVRERASGAGYDFTFQTQSLFNGACGDRPHFVYTDHVALARSLAGWDEGLGRPSAGWLDLERRIYSDATHVFTFGPRIRQLLIERYGLAASRTSAVGGGASVFPREAPDTTPERYGRRRIVFVGVEWERKGGPVLIEAFRAARQALPDATLTIIGCNPAIAVEGCMVLGKLPADAVAEQYQQASCFCMPSMLEPYGLVFTEAMHFALPVVAADVGDVSSIVSDGETGRLVPPGDSVALAAALVDVLGDPERARAMGGAALEAARSYTWEEVAARIAEKLPGGRDPLPTGQQAPAAASKVLPPMV